MDDMERRLAAKARLIPKDGFNVVAVDNFESDPDLELFLVGHYATRKEAEKVAAERRKGGEEKVFVYDPTS